MKLIRCDPSSTLFRCADWLNVQTYDYRGSQDKIAEHHSALMTATSAEGDDKFLNQVGSFR